MQPLLLAAGRVNLKTSLHFAFPPVGDATGEIVSPSSSRCRSCLATATRQNIWTMLLVGERKQASLVVFSDRGRVRAAIGGASTSQGRSYGIFQKAFQRRNVIATLAAAKELPQLSLLDALELTMLIARKDPSRYPHVAARWLRRLLEEHPDVTIEEAALAASCLVALPGASYREAAQTLKAMAETATRCRRACG